MASQDHNLIWQQTLSILEKEINRPSFETWIKVLAPLSYENGTFEIGANRQIVKEWVETRHLSLIRKALETVAGQPVLVNISISQQAPAEEPLPPSLPEAPSLKSSVAPASTPVSFPKGDESYSPLNPKYTFDSFVIGNSNRFAHAASLAVAEMPAKVYNPFFIYGGVGLGKTHLMHAIGYRIMQIHPENKV